MGKLIKNYGEISLWQLGKDEIPDMTFFVLDNYYMQYWKQHIDVSGEELRNAIAEDLTHFDHGTFFAIKDLDGRLLASIKAIKILKDDKFPLENDFQITYSDLERRVVPLVGDVWLFGRLVVDRDYFNSKPEFVRFRNIIFRILICKAIECMSYSPDNICGCRSLPETSQIRYRYDSDRLVKNHICIRSRSGLQPDVRIVHLLFKEYSFN